MKPSLPRNPTNRMAAIEDRRAENVSYLEEGVRILELAQSAHSAYLRQKPEGKKALLDFVLLNSTWANGELSVTFRQPFDMLAVAAEAASHASQDAECGSRDYEEWRRERDSNSAVPGSYW